MEPFVRFLEALRSSGCSTRQKGPSKVRATCPAHRDKRPSLSVSWTGSKVLFNCFSGCASHSVLSALGLTYGDLFLGPAPEKRVRAVEVAAYRYVSESGVLMAEKVRYEPKRFRWRRPDPTQAAGVSWDLGDVAGHLPLYRLPELAGKWIVILEGEKAVDRLRSLGFTATCPPAGASSWPDRFSLDLHRLQVREVVILPDADGPGQRHAERVAASLRESNRETGVNVGVRILRLPGLATGGDVVDWLDAGGNGEQLRRLISQTPRWLPNLTQLERAARRKRLNAERQRRFRERARALRLAASA